MAHWGMRNNTASRITCFACDWPRFYPKHPLKHPEHFKELLLISESELTLSITDCDSKKKKGKEKYVKFDLISNDSDFLYT